jgi:hypothetical protein
LPRGVPTLARKSLPTAYTPSHDTSRWPEQDAPGRPESCRPFGFGKEPQDRMTRLPATWQTSLHASSTTLESTPTPTRPSTGRGQHRVGQELRIRIVFEERDTNSITDSSCRGMGSVYWFRKQIPRVQSEFEHALRPVPMCYMHAWSGDTSASCIHGDVW